MGEYVNNPINPYYSYNPQQGYVNFINPNINRYSQGVSVQGIPTNQQGIQIGTLGNNAVTPVNTNLVSNGGIAGGQVIGNSVYTPIGDKGAMVNTNNPNWGINSNGQSTYLGGTGYDWVGLGLNTGFSLFNAYQGYQNQKLAKQQFEDQRNLNHANYRMQAKAFNNNLRNQQSGRGYIGMSGTAKRALGAEYQTRKAEDDY